MKNLLALLAATVLPLSAAPLSGTRTIGPTGDFPSLTSMAEVMATVGMSGALSVSLQANYVSSVETFPLTFANLPTTAANTLTIRPEFGATNLSITSADTTAATVDLNGAKFVTFDGRPGGVGTARELTIGNTSTSGVAVRFINESSSNALRFLTLQGASISASSGTVVFSTTTGANGNDDNTIDSCDLRDGATTPANALYSSGSTATVAQSNSGNSVSNCNVFNFHSATTDAAGVRLDGGSIAWTITGNSFYQTASRAAVAANVRAIFINNSSGDNFTVTGNFIGGSAANAGGAAWTTTGTAAAYLFQGIRLNVGTTASSSAQGNTIRNFSWTTSGSATTQSGIWCGIHVQAGNVNIGTVTGNTIGSGMGTGSISVTTSGTGGTIFGISSASSGTVAIANNTIGSITTSGSATTVSASLVGIQVIAGTNTISDNTIGSTVTASSLNAATSSTSNGPQLVTGILSSGASARIESNRVANLKNNSVQASFNFSAQISGIVTFAGVNTIIGNTVRNLSTISRDFPAIYGFPAVDRISAIGISQSSSASGQTISQNIIHSLANTAASGTVFVVGIHYRGSSTGANFMAQNLVHSLAISGSDVNSILCGIYFDSGTVTAQNNMVRLGFDADGNSTAGTSSIYGILDGVASAGRSFYHNSIYLGGTQTSRQNRTFAFINFGASNARDFRNNIFVNARSNSGGTGKHYAIFHGTNATTNGLSVNNNLYLASGTGGMLGFFANADTLTLASLQTATGQDSQSLNAEPLFVNPNGTAATVDLHVLAQTPAKAAGSPIPTVTDDYDGQLRSTSQPFIGADELPGVFQQWAQANAVGGDPNLPGANGLANLLNFAFGLNPASPSRNELSHSGNIITPGGLTTQLVPGPPTAKFIRRADYLAAGLTYTAQFSADLSNWETDNTAPAVVASDGVNQVVSLSYPLLSGGAQARFFRLVVGLQ